MTRIRRMTKPQITIFVFFAAFCRTAHDTDEERDYESETADNQISLLVGRLHTRYSGWSVVSGQWSVVFLTLFSSLSSVRNLWRDEGVASTATANRKFAGASPCRRGDRTRNARATLRWLERLK